MPTYFTSISIHFYLALFVSIITVLLADTSVKMLGGGLLVCLPIWILYIHRVNDMSPEDISKAFGFYSNKFLDCSHE